MPNIIKTVVDPKIKSLFSTVAFQKITLIKREAQKENPYFPVEFELTAQMKAEGKLSAKLSDSTAKSHLGERGFLFLVFLTGMKAPFLLGNKNLLVG